MNSRTACIILHYSSIELYPPVINLLRFISGKGSTREWIVITTNPSCSNLSELAVPGIKIIRRGVSGNNISRFSRAWGYFYYHLSAVYYLITRNPLSVLYFETLSSFPVVICRYLFRRRVKLLVHYHEYVSADERLNGSAFFRFLNRKEKALLPIASWISHTNRERLELFSKDKNLNKSVLHILPNYPPAAWNTGRLKQERTIPFKVVYVGSLSLDTLYLREFASWIISQQGRIKWDIYSLNPDQDAIDYIASLNSDMISICGAVQYDDLPVVLRNYDAGVILYKGHIPNFIYNAPNKLFEYHVCGLDVWFPDEMLGSLPYVTDGSYPKIVALDFDHLENVELSVLSDRAGLSHKVGAFACENVLTGLLAELEID